MMQFIAAAMLANPIGYQMCVKACEAAPTTAQLRQCGADCYNHYIRGQANAGSRPYSTRCETYEPECEGPFFQEPERDPRF